MSRLGQKLGLKSKALSSYFTQNFVRVGIHPLAKGSGDVHKDLPTRDMPSQVRVEHWCPQSTDASDGNEKIAKSKQKTLGASATGSAMPSLVLNASKQSAYSSERQMKLSRIKFDQSDSGEVWWGYVIDNNHFQDSGFSFGHAILPGAKFIFGGHSNPVLDPLAKPHADPPSTPSRGCFILGIEQRF